MLECGVRWRWRETLRAQALKSWSGRWRIEFDGSLHGGFVGRSGRGGRGLGAVDGREERLRMGAFGAGEDFADDGTRGDGFGEIFEVLVLRQLTDGAVGLERAQHLEGPLVGAFVLVDVALPAVDGIEVVLLEGTGGFGAGDAEVPGGVQELIEEVLLDLADGLDFDHEASAQGFEVVLTVIGNVEVLRRETVFERILRGRDFVLKREHGIAPQPHGSSGREGRGYLKTPNR